LLCRAAGPLIHIPPVETSVTIEGQPVTIPVSGEASLAPKDGGQAALEFRLNAGLADLQIKLTAILRAELNQDNRCGDRLSVERAALAPDAPAALVSANIHFEKWGCAKAFGKQIVKKLIGGNGVVKVRVTPAVLDGNAVKLRAEVISIEADGQLGEAMRTEALGNALKEKIEKSLVSAMEKAGDFRNSLPPAAQQVVAIRSARFTDGGEGRLSLAVNAEAQLPAEEAKALLDRLGH
jgi:hypothetical protein